MATGATERRVPLAASILTIASILGAGAASITTLAWNGALLRNRPSGYLFASMLLVMTLCMGAALTAMVAWSAKAAGRSPLEAAPFAVHRRRRFRAHVGVLSFCGARAG